METLITRVDISGKKSGGQINSPESPSSPEKQTDAARREERIQQCIELAVL